MKIRNKQICYTKNIYEVEQEENESLSDSEMLRLCDGSNGAPFGGYVEPMGARRYKVTVYTD